MTPAVTPAVTTLTRVRAGKKEGRSSRDMTIIAVAALSLATPTVQAQPVPRPSHEQSLSANDSGGERDGRIRVQFSARQQTTLSSELPAKISKLSLKDGDSFQSGQVLVEFDCSVYRAQLDKAVATTEAARQTSLVNRRLGVLNAISTLEIDQAEAKLKEAEADVAERKAIVDKCTITAPFSGRVAKVYAEPFQYVTQGKPLLDLVDSQRPEVKLLVPSRWLSWLAPGARFNIRVDDLGKTYAARVTRLGVRIDPVSQTVPLTADVEGQVVNLLPGMSGWASFRTGR